MTQTYKALIIILLFGFMSCNSDKSEDLRRQILQAAKDQKIDEAEWESLLGAAKETDYKACADLRAFIEKTTQRKGAPTMPDCKEGNDVDNSKTNDCSMFIENSNSMKGYFVGATEFKDALMAIPSRIQDRGGKCKFYFITKEPREISTDYQGYIKKLDEGYKNIDLNQSLLDDLIAQVSDVAVKEKRIAILASDFIYDIGKRNPQDVLPKLQYAITDHLQKYRKKGDYGVLVLKMNSLFDGQYYNFKGGYGTKIKETRPYYIWMFGSTAQLINVFRNLNFDNLKGFDEYVLFYPDKGSADVFYSILPQTNVKGTIKRDKDSKSTVHKIVDVKIDDRSKSLEFTVAADLSNIPTNTAYLTDMKNYELVSDKNDAFELVSIQPIGEVKLHNNDSKWSGSATHLLTIKTAKISEDTQTLQIRLLKQMPQWIEKSSTDDDVDIKSQLNKTFGLKYAMNGLMTAYILPGTKPTHIKFDIEINK
jgi:hypothetical protein